MGGSAKAIVWSIACVVVGAVLGTTYIPRLSNHAGYWLVPFDDVPIAEPPPRPRHTAVIVVDGLRRDAAETMASARSLGESGQCWISDQGDYTVSRPVYALLSTGVEVDRTGARNNEETSPLAAESIWQVARQAGRTVHGSSHLPWFRELFPDGFDTFTLARTHADDVLAVPELADIELLHPLYVDEAGHHHGAASAEYRAAVARADLEIGRLLARLDLTQDLVVLTADHGHRDAGGHGGAQPEIREVLLCVAGRNIRHADGAFVRFDGRATAPLLSVLLGLRFPRHLRAGEDGLDAIFAIADVPEAWAVDRRRAVDRARDANRSALEGWLRGSPGTWSRWYQHRAGFQWLRLALVAIVAMLMIMRLRPTRWLLGMPLFTWLAHRLVLGPFDYTVINLREPFIARAFGVVALSIAASLLLRQRFAPGRLVSDVRAWLALLLVANVGHVVVYGWPLGFPLPPAPARYFPFLGAFLLIGWGLAYAFIAGGRSSRPGSPSPPVQRG